MESERYQRYLEGKVTPELLNHFSRRDALELIKMFHNVEPHKYMEFVREQPWGIEGSLYDYLRKPEDKEYLANEIKGKRVIEFGDREGTNKRFFLELGAESYEASDPISNTKGLDIDALTHLIRQPDESAIVCSFAVLYSRVLYDPYLFKKSPTALREYQKELGNQIYRVTPKNSITLHMLERQGDLTNTGFIEERVFNDYLGFKTFRKKGE
jgi:hypothetical protein